MRKEYCTEPGLFLPTGLTFSVQTSLIYFTNKQTLAYLEGYLTPHRQKHKRNEIS